MGHPSPTTWTLRTSSPLHEYLGVLLHDLFKLVYLGTSLPIGKRAVGLWLKGLRVLFCVFTFCQHWVDDTLFSNVLTECKLHFLKRKRTFRSDEAVKIPVSDENMAKLVSMSENLLIRRTKTKLDNSTNSSVVITIALVKECWNSKVSKQLRCMLKTPKSTWRKQHITSKAHQEISLRINYDLIRMYLWPNRIIIHK